jgi:hypothetical protein
MAQNRLRFRRHGGHRSDMPAGTSTAEAVAPLSDPTQRTAAGDGYAASMLVCSSSDPSRLRPTAGNPLRVSAGTYEGLGRPQRADLVQCRRSMVLFRYPFWPKAFGLGGSKACAVMCVVDL